MALALSACAAGAGVGRPTTGEVRGFGYSDDQGLQVYTLGISVEQPISEEVTLLARGYQELEPLLAGDPRLGSLHAHAASAEARLWLLGSRAAPGSLALTASYGRSAVVYEELDEHTVTADEVGVGILGGY